MDARNSENDMLDLDGIYDNENNRKYVAAELEEDTNNLCKDPSQKYHVIHYKT